MQPQRSQESKEIQTEAEARVSDEQEGARGWPVHANLEQRLQDYMTMNNARFESLTKLLGKMIIG